MKTVTYADRAAFIDPIAAELESIANRLRMGAISDELAQVKLTNIISALKEGA